MTASDLRRCRDELSDLIAAIESAARALGDGLAAAPESCPVEALVHLQTNDVTAQRCAHGRDALAVLAGLDDPALVALGCRLQARQLALAAADFRAAVDALLAQVPAGPGIAEPGEGLRRAAGRLDAVVGELGTLEDSAAPAPEAAARQRAEVVARLNPAYTMAGERAVLARFLAGDDEPPDGAVTAATDDVEEFFL